MSWRFWRSLSLRVVAAKAVPPTTEIYGIPIPTIRVRHLVPVPPTAQPVPAVDVSATPSGWVPVAYGDAQVSVPATFCEVDTTPDSLFIGSPSGASTIFSCGPQGRVGSQATVVNLVSIRQVPRPYAGEKPTIRNGVPVYLRQHSGDEFSYFAPSVGIEISAGGPLARRVLDSLTRSPRAVALAAGPAPQVPSSWHSLTFAGMRFAVPAGWPVQRQSLFFGSCSSGPPEGYGLDHATVVLDTDARVSLPGCPIISPPPVRPPANGVRIDTGPYFPAPPSRFISTRCLSLHGLTACPATSPEYSILVLRVTVPGRTKPVFVSIGLAGNGMVARTILYSLRPA